MKADICSDSIVVLKNVEFEEQRLSMCAIADKISVLFVIFPSTSEENVMQSGKRVKDRRIQKTQKLLHEALVSLMHEKSYDSIVVKEILNRANVGRSTFYTHFRDKDELLVSGIHEMLRSVQLTELPVSAKPYEKLFGSAFRSSSTTSSTGTRERAGWEPEGEPSFMDTFKRYSLN